MVPEIFQGEDRTVNVKDEREKFEAERNNYSQQVQKIYDEFERNCNPYDVVFSMAVEHHF